MANDRYTYAEKSGAEYVPGGPLFFVFHGTGGNEIQFLDVATELMPTAHVISPRGDVSEMGALRFFRRAAEGVYDFDDLAKRTSNMKSFVEAHVEHHKPSAVIGLGYSNGANILALVMDQAPALFDHAMLMHPLVTWEFPMVGDMNNSRILITAGGRDPICPPDMTGKLAEMFERRGAAVQTFWHAGGHEIAPAEFEAIREFAAEVAAVIAGPDALQIEREDDGKKGRYFVRAPGGVEAEMTYTWGRPGCVIIDHTEVPDVFRGQGVGLRLLKQLVADARSTPFEVVPLCPFAAAQFKRHSELTDVLDDSVKLKSTV
ncbi:MAG: N-acetyltransferase [Pseudomonadota bacterium]